MKEPIISLKGIKKFYGSGAGRQQVLYDVDLQVERSTLISIIGTSGSGKSTLLNIIGGLDRDFSGIVDVNGKHYNRLKDPELAKLRNTTIGFIFQSFNLLDHLTCWENVALPNYFDRRRTNDPKKRASKMLARVGLEEKVDAKPGNLSGGQKQRVAIARALFNKPEILLCDEPTGNLDSATGRQIIELFKSLNQQEGITLILVTHEKRLSSVANRVIRLEDGRIVDEQIQQPHAPEAPDYSTDTTAETTDQQATPSAVSAGDQQAVEEPETTAEQSAANAKAQEVKRDTDGEPKTAKHSNAKNSNTENKQEDTA
jgi:ABC-type lipoprotein export system ATPase subunit